ncbi:MAG: hypothetical protein ACFFCI_01410 [Promethearchaeota archaeon]
MEKKAEKYDKGIDYLTLGCLPNIKKYISDILGRIILILTTNEWKTGKT